MKNNTHLLVLVLCLFVSINSCNKSPTGNTTESEIDESDWPRDTETIVVDVTNPATGQTWMDRNLGASRAATSSTDAQAFGDLYQWGRAADGHQMRNSPTTTTRSNTNQPGHGSFIAVMSTSFEDPVDWRNPQNDELWQGVNGVNNPCPSGYRLPTEEEWDNEIQSWSSRDAEGALASPLKLPLSGTRFSANGGIIDVGSLGYYWSASVSGGTAARHLRFGNSAAGIMADTRAYGDSVRCIKN